ncbi:MAG: ribosome recycling factor [Firmicutes bacterium]|nr:ribosome recycling factor [Bacillota bacterium]
MEYLNDRVNMMLLEFEEKLGKAAGHVTNEFLMVRAGRVNAAMVERIMVDYFGTPTPMRQLANISCSDSRTIVISLWDTAILRETVRALTVAQLGANPIDDGRLIRMIFPLLTEERRKELVKQVRTIAEQGKVTMRNERRSAMDSLKKISKDDNISEDEKASIEKDIQKLLDNYVGSVDKLLAKKESEILEI